MTISISWCRQSTEQRVGKIAARAAGSSRLASCLLLAAFRIPDHGKTRSLGHGFGSGTISGIARACAHLRCIPRLPSGFPRSGLSGSRKTLSARNFKAVCTSVASQPRRCSGGSREDPVRCRKARSCVVAGYFASPQSASSARSKRLFQSGRRRV